MIDRTLAFTMCLLGWAAGCARPGTPVPDGVKPSGAGEARDAGPRGSRDIPPLVIPPPRDTFTPRDTTGFWFHLNEGRGGPAAGEAVRTATGVALAPGEASRLLARLPALPQDTTGGNGFALPAQTLPPPRAGTTVLGVFPPPDTVPPPTEPAATPALDVLRVQPEGEIPMASEVTIAFSQPMVPLTSRDSLAAQSIPVRLSPQPAGRWVWLDSRTLRFVATGRLPMATRYTVEVPAGTQAPDGGTLREARRVTFSTPPPQAIGSHPHGRAVVHDPVLVVAFDQRIEPAAVLPSIRVTAGGRNVPIRLASEAEVRADSALARWLAVAEPGRWVAFRATGSFPADADVRVVVEPGTPSAEGPLRTVQPQQWRFHTYGPLRIVGHQCGYRGQPCRPGMPWTIEFNNPLDSVPAALVRVEPAVPNLSVVGIGDRLVLSGTVQPQTRYRVTVGSGIRDRFGQTLGRSQTVEFAVGTPARRLWAQQDEIVVLDPTAPPQFPVYSTGHRRLRVRLLRAGPEHWEAFQMSRYRRGPNEPFTPPGREVWSGLVTVEGDLGETTETRINLRPALEDGLGQTVVVVEPETTPTADDERWQSRVVTWVQATRIGLAAFADAEGALGWTTSLLNGAPLPGTELSLRSTGSVARTSGDGTGTFELPGGGMERNPVLVARLGRDLAILPGGGWQRYGMPDVMQWYVFTDRGLYRPGEEVRARGWIRQVPLRKGGDVSLPPRGVESVGYTVRDPRGVEITRGTADLDALGGFRLQFRIPAGSNLGGAMIELQAGEARHVAPIRVDEFRRPEFEVTLAADPGPYVVGGTAEIVARAAYVSGGGLPGAEVRWQVRASPGNFAPPNWPGWTFGIRDFPWMPRPYGNPDAPSFNNLTGRTDATGTHRLRITWDSVRPPRPYNVNAEAAVEDINRQTWTARTTLLVHPAALYVGLRSTRGWLPQGEPLIVEAISVDLAGRPVAGRPMALRATRLEWRRGPTGEWSRQEAEDPQACNVVSAPEPVRCTFRTTGGGLMRVLADARDTAGRPTRTELEVWVAGGDAFTPRAEGARQQEATVVADRPEYQPGDTAVLLVRAPFAPAEGLLTLRRGGVVHAERFRMEGTTHTLRIPITEQYLPNLHAQVDLIGVRRGTDFAVGSTELQIPARRRTLTVRALPRDSVVEPGGRTTIGVEVRDSRGAPVAGATVALVAADEAVLGLIGYQLPDPIAIFYPRRDPGTRDQHLRSHVLFLLSDSVAAGTLQGTVTDAESGMPLPGAQVQLTGAAQRTAVTDQTGRFTFTGLSAGSYTLVVSQVGRMRVDRAVRLTAEAGANLRIALAPEAVQLDALAVTATGRVEARVRARDGGGPPVEAAPPPPPPPPVMDAPPPPVVAGLQAFSGKGAAVGPAIALRTDFNPLALWEPGVRTDARGRAQVPVRLPGSLTRYRIMAVAVSGARHFGIGEAAITARQELMVRPSPPRFLRFGDRFELPVVVQNNTSAPLQAELAMRATGLEIDNAGRRVSVPAGDRVEVRFPARASRAGTARVQIAATAGTRSDAALLELPVYTPATAEAFATYGVVDAGAVRLPFAPPGNVLSGFGGLEIGFSSTALIELTDALLYLQSYPYECSEQIASRLLANAALRDVLLAFRPAGTPDSTAVAAAMERDIRRLAALQNPDGGWGFWRQGERSWPYVSIHVAHALERARAKGYAVPQETLGRATSYLRDIERHIPREYDRPYRESLVAYALYVRDRLGDPAASAEARRRVAANGPAGLPLEANGWLLSVLADDPAAQTERRALLRHITNRATETAAAAHFVAGYEESKEAELLLLHSNQRTDGVLLEALIAADPGNDLIPKVARGLLGHRVRGRWSNTQENAWALLALDRYFATYERTVPDFVARAWLGDHLAAEHSFRGRSTVRSETTVPIRVLVGSEPPNTLTLGKQGAGRMYYRAGLRYAPADLMLRPADYGFRVERVYEAVDSAGDVVRLADGRWQIRAGARVRVRISMIAPAQRVHVALADPLPAGLEPLNPELRGTESTPSERMRPEPSAAEPSDWWRRAWFEHQNLRDERAEAFRSLLPAGVYTYTYMARATTPGEFVVAPPHAEEMYSPETFGRGATDRVIVVPEPAR